MIAMIALLRHCNTVFWEQYVRVYARSTCLRVYIHLKKVCMSRKVNSEQLWKKALNNGFGLVNAHDASLLQSAQDVCICT
jgi:hypothetical protein